MRLTPWKVHSEFRQIYRAQLVDVKFVKHGQFIAATIETAQQESKRLSKTGFTLSPFGYGLSKYFNN
jgi:hypothetical protein